MYIYANTPFCCPFAGTILLSGIIYIYVCIYTYMCVCVNVYVYICMYRERERERDRVNREGVFALIHIHITNTKECIYPYVY